MPPSGERLVTHVPLHRALDRTRNRHAVIHRFEHLAIRRWTHDFPLGGEPTGAGAACIMHID
jgi:hypothetical protein